MFGVNPLCVPPKDAYICFMRTEMEWLVIGDSLFEKKMQPNWKEDDNWMNDYELD